jgi:ammonia channel protein AmtB
MGQIQETEPCRHGHRHHCGAGNHHASFGLRRSGISFGDRADRGRCVLLLVSIVKQRFEIDDSLDVFAVHGVGGATGILLTALCVDAAQGGAGLPELRSMSYQFAVQLLGVIAILVWSVAARYAIVIVVKAAVGLRVGKEDEEKGLDQTTHGESGYNI